MSVMNVIVNGEKIALDAPLSIAGLLEHLALPAQRIAVELNKEVVRRADWNEIKVSDGDRIEIIHFVGGG